MKHVTNCIVSSDKCPCVFLSKKYIIKLFPSLFEIAPLVIENKIFDKRHQFILIISLNIYLLEDGRGSLFKSSIALCHVYLKMAM
jgi:hypothetical protein